MKLYNKSSFDQLSIEETTQLILQIRNNRNIASTKSNKNIGITIPSNLSAEEINLLKKLGL